ncbi:aminotransferase class I/II-fold pyridoxal phosphate-dependent enzyme [Gulbenkiania mobilis]|uniref:Putative 8-amino-7-oxononanoate synthase n=1 Tax=Gulbenkiania mobilis TaxID=397457 RepID=A0ABY2CZH9_GULMO|nr:histidinol-phosphate aminotransferase [Gulbenkiania mobilis]
MSRFASHLADHTIVNPFPGLVRLEQTIGRPVTVRIGSNESVAEPTSPLAARFGPALAELARTYPDPYAQVLRARLAALAGVAPEEVLVDTGADSLILLALRLFCAPGDTVVTSAGTYPTFRYFAEGCGTRIEEVPYHEAQGLRRPDLAGLAERARVRQARLVYLANPDNPTGWNASGDAIRTLVEALPEDCTLLLDEAYSDFCIETADRPLAGVLPGAFRLRTLSKAYALAGLRVGYAVAPAGWIGKADEIRPQFAVSSVAQAAAAAVLDEPTYSARLVSNTVQLRQTLERVLSDRGLQVLPSWTNFVAIRYDSAATAAARQQALWAAGVAVHRPPHPAMQDLLRVTVHPDALQTSILDGLCPTR